MLKKYGCGDSNYYGTALMLELDRAIGFIIRSALCFQEIDIFLNDCGYPNYHGTAIIFELDRAMGVKPMCDYS